MSRIGKKPVLVPDNVSVSIDKRQVVVASGTNRLTLTHRPEVTVRMDDDSKQIIVERQNDNRASRAFHGLTRSLIANMVEGVTKQFSKELEVQGVGWNAKLEAKALALSVGYADVRKVPVPDGISVEVAGSRIKVTGIDKQMVGQFAANVRRQRPPEPYNGRGIRYVGEHVIRKQGKAFASSGA